MATEFRLPELGENIKYGDLIKIMVSAGDKVAQDQPVIELETDKATIEVPSPVSGTVKEIFVKNGDKLKVGQIIFTVDGGDSAPKNGSGEAKPAEVAAPAAPAAATQAPAPQVPAAARQAIPVIPVPAVTPASATQVSEPVGPAPAAPSVRRIAREFGVNINEVPGTGPGGRISVEDVKRYTEQAARGAIQTGATLGAAPLPDFSRWGAIDRQAMTQIRRKTAEHMAQAWANVTQVTQHELADITNLEAVRKQYAARVEKAGGKLTMTAIAVKVVAAAVKVFPQFAASLDMARSEIIYKKYVHIGVAVDTDRGLLVPVIRDADRKNIIEISADLSRLAEKARNKKLTLEEMDGGVFTITNLGGIGGTYFSPIVNYPEVAILGLSRSRTEPVYTGTQFEPRLMLPLSLSYDHRLIDGADAARFIRWIAEAMEQPFLLPLEG
ncbi:MAG TPA: 2-oxo acid dehydrogenase subunit E2 [Terriglobia bacterium]|nr:2-oxo acid dehydrogenase subunit E2 [Terriglobia bacterium]